jgi:hypothetical protein
LKHVFENATSGQLCRNYATLENGRPAEQQCQNYLLCQFAKYVACLH